MVDDVAGGEGPTPDLGQLAADHADRLFEVKNLSRLEQVIANAIQTGVTTAIGAIVASAGGIGALVGKFIREGEEIAAPVLAPMMASLIQSAFGVDVPPSALARINDATARKEVGRAIGATVLGTLDTGAGELTPGKDGAEKLIGMLAHLAIDSWAEGTIVEWLSGLCGLLHELEGLTKLAPDVVQATGLDELGRIGLRPLATVTIATPLTWYANNTSRPNLLSEGDIVRAFFRGDYTGAEAAEELSRLGYSDKRQDVILKNALRFPSVSDLQMLVRAKVMDGEEALANVRAQGYDDIGARHAVLVEQIKHLNTIRDDSVGALRSAFVDRRIDESQLRTYLTAIFDDDDEIASHVIAMQTARGLNTKTLSPNEAKACALAGILPIAAYRDALRRDGYDEDSVLALELLLELEIQKGADVETLRKQKQEQADADAEAKKAAALAKQQQIDDQRALARRGSLADLRRAVVRGLIPLSRLVEVLQPQYDADTVQTLVDLVEADRADFVAQQQAADEARKRAALRHVDVGQYEAAVLAGILTIDQFRAAIVDLKFAAADVDVLVRTLAARKADLDQAKAQRAAALLAASSKAIDLGRFEQLVRRGHRTLADYDALLASLGYDAGARAGMAELLQLQIADDQAARKLRDDQAKANAARGLSLDQARRAAILGLTSVDDFAHFLARQQYGVDAQATLVAELRHDVDEAAAARRKRDAAGGSGVDTRLPLATVARAARLGIVSPAAYRQRLVAAGYSADDVAIDMDLLAFEIAQAQQARARAAAAAAKTTDRGLSLDQVARAVKLGEQTIDDYRARAVELGYSDDDVTTLVAVLVDDVQTIQDAEARHSTIDGQLHARNLSLGELDAAVKAGQMTIDAYFARLQELGYGDDDAELLTTLLALKLSTAGGGA